MRRALILILLVCWNSWIDGVGQQAINPHTQVKWVKVSGSGAPTIPCTSVNYGEPYADTTNNLSYFCSSSGWTSNGGTASNPAGPAFAVNFANNAVTSFQGDPSITINPSTHQLNLGSDLPTVHQACSANACKATQLVTAYGAVGDALQRSASGYFTCSMTVGGTTLTCTNTNFSGLTDIGKFATIGAPTAQPFANIAFTPLSGWTTNNTAQIVSVTDATHVVLNKTALNSFTGNLWYGTDNSPAFAACAQATFVSPATGGICIKPPGQYLMATAPYYVLTGASDDGGYGQAGGGTGGTLSTTLGTNGVISSCAVTSSGSGYTINSTMRTIVTGGCNGSAQCGNQAYITATSDSGGHIASCSVVFGGYNYSSPPTATIVTVGGDGATATTTTSGGAITTPSVGAGGSGYVPSSGSAINFYAVKGSSTCNTIGFIGTGWVPIVAKGTAASNAAGQITSMTIGTNATGCGVTAPTIVFGDHGACNSNTAGSPVWVQCSNMTPLAPTQFPVNVYLGSEVSFVGESSTLGNATSDIGTWDGQTFDNLQPWIYGGYVVGLDLQYFTASNAILDIGVINNANYSHIGGITFNGGLGMWTQSTDIGFTASDLVFNSLGSWINGGQWCHRIDQPLGCGGFFDATSARNIIPRLPAYGGPGSGSQKLDDWFDKYFWCSGCSGNSPDFLEIAKFPATISQRQTGHPMNIPQGANTHTYPGVSSLGLGIFARDSGETGGGTIDTILAKGISRNIFCCVAGSLTMHTLSAEGATPITGTNDPYRNATQLEGAVKSSDIFCGPRVPTLDIIGWSGGTVNRIIWSIFNQGDPVCTRYHDALQDNASNSQPQENPAFTAQIPFPQGLSLPGSSTDPHIDLYHTSAQLLNGRINAQANGVEIQCGNGSVSDCLDILSNGITPRQPFTTVPLSSSRVGTFTCTSGGTIGVTNGNFSATSTVWFGIKTVGGTPGALAQTTPNPGVGFSVICATGDTSTYNYGIPN
jgi:hypothetical protein